MNYTSKTLGELLSSSNQAIRRNATGILKQLQKDFICLECGKDRLKCKCDLSYQKIVNRKERIWGQGKF